ncbi:hypothetical protein DRJ17_03200 [Candidatus Woesearchaeota archaeon]|nr:MAG: hypothetical protein DRJ17_03200 [Candidatus Woesearchaeota archaeon]
MLELMYYLIMIAMYGRRSKASLFFIIFLFFISLLAPFLYADENRKNVIVVSIQEEITEATEVLFRNVIKEAEAIGAKLVVVLLDTPGGSVSSVKNIMVMMESSKVPVAVLVYPVGATAWSGGAYILMASHIAAMASGTIVGSAQPVMMTLAGPVYVNESKVINALVGLMVHHARIHSRNTTVARLFVEQNLNLGAREALENHVIEVIADSVEELLHELEDKVLIKVVVNGEEVWQLIEYSEAEKYETISMVEFKGISSANIVYFKPGPQIYLLRFLTNPLIAELLLIMGLLILFTGLKTPGYGMEIAGALMVAASIIGLGVIGVDFGGLLFLVIGFTLMLLELKTHIGVLAILGALSIVVGGLMLIPSGNLWLTEEEMGKIWSSIVLSSAILLSIFGVLVFKVAKAQRRKPVVGPEKLIGEVGVALKDLRPDGEVRVLGEIWRARSLSGVIKKGEKIRVVKREGLTLLVEKL